MKHISGDIYGLLMRKGLSAKSVGADKGSRIKGRRGAQNAAQPRQFAGAREEYAGVRLVWTNPQTMTKRARSRACLVIVS